MDSNRVQVDHLSTISPGPRLGLITLGEGKDGEPQPRPLPAPRHDLLGRSDEINHPVPRLSLTSTRLRTGRVALLHLLPESGATRKETWPQAAISIGH